MESALTHKHSTIMKSGIDSYKRGYDEGREDGYKQGEEKGYDDGYAEGNEEGFNEGFRKGSNHGLFTGMIIGSVSVFVGIFVMTAVSRK